MTKQNISTGWISLYRSIFKHWIAPVNREFTDFEAWIYILLEVNHSNQKVKIGKSLFTCKKGESLNSLDTWARLFKWNKSKVRRFFKLLESDNMIKLKNVKKTTHLTVCNYEDYQNKRNDNETKVKRKRNDNETIATPNNNGNNEDNSNMPSKELFISYASETDSKCDLHKVGLKYESWVVNGWKDGNNKEIKNWRTKLLNTLPYLKKDLDDSEVVGVNGRTLNQAPRPL
jgi:hypothetical protein